MDHQNMTSIFVCMKIRARLLHLSLHTSEKIMRKMHVILNLHATYVARKIKAAIGLYNRLAALAGLCSSLKKYLLISAETKINICIGYQ